MHRGTIVAGWGGRLTAVAALAWPLLQEQIFGTTRAEPLDFVLAFVIAAFLWSGATAAMSVGPAAQPAAAPGRPRPGPPYPRRPRRPAARRGRTTSARTAAAGSLVTVTSSGVPVGIVSEAALAATPEDRRPWVPVSTVARTLEDGLRLPADISGEDLVTAISRTPAAEYLLLEQDGSICGVLTTADVDRAFQQGGH